MGDASRTDAVLRAVREDLERRRLQLDAADDVVSITLTIKLQVGTAWVRGTRYEEERLAARRPG